MRRIIPDHRALLARLSSALSESLHYSRYSAPLVGVTGVFSFPLYYYVWAYLVPQPYENLWLRLLGALLCLPLALFPFWPERLKRYFTPYWVVSVGYVLPFFFTYMLLRNDLSLLWSMSTMCALFLLVLAVHHWLPVTLIFLVSSVLAWGCFLLTDHSLLSLSDYLSQLPIYLFVIVAGGLFSYTAQLVRDEKLNAYAAVGRNIAHELRTPLLGMKGSILALTRYLPDLIQTYRAAEQAGIQTGQIRANRLEPLALAAERINDEIEYANVIIDMLLFSARQQNLSIALDEINSAAETVTNAVRRYPFKSDQERALVQVVVDQDFQYRGSSLLVTHALFNLIKNALHSVLKARKGSITLHIYTWGKSGVLLVRDTGLGISLEEQQHIFRHFYSSKSVEEGSGIGLSFCRAVMKGLGGEIDFQSRLGDFTEFSLTFPDICHLAKKHLGQTNAH